MCLEFNFTYAMQISLRSVNPPIVLYIPIYMLIAALNSSITVQTELPLGSLYSPEGLGSLSLYTCYSVFSS